VSEPPGDGADVDAGARATFTAPIQEWATVGILADIWTWRYTTRLQQYCMLPNLPLTGFKHAACGSAELAEFAARIAGPPGRSRLLRAAWPGGRGGRAQSQFAMLGGSGGVAGQSHSPHPASAISPSCTAAARWSVGLGVA